MIQISPKTERRMKLILKGVFGVVVALISVFLMWYEFGIEIFHSEIFIALLTVWAFYGFFLFWDSWDEASKKTTGEKIDDLIIKIDELIAEIRSEKEGSADGK